MTSARRLYRLNLAAAGLGGLAVIIVLGVAISKISLAPLSVEELRAACGSLLPAELSPLAAALVGLAGLVLSVLVRGLRSALIEARAQLRVRAALRSVVEHNLEGAPVRIFSSSRPQAFCAGLIRPRVFLSTAARDRLSQAELRAVLAHEGHHVRRREPLRLLVARILADALFFIPALRRLERRYAELAELAADEAAVRTAGSAGLASALLKLGASDHREVAVALAPERVDHLCGAPTRWRLETPVLAFSFFAITGVSGAALWVSAMAGGARVEVLAVVAQSCMALMLALAVAAVGALWRRRRVDPGSG